MLLTGRTKGHKAGETAAVRFPWPGRGDHREAARVTQTVVLADALGLHARPAAVVARTAAAYAADVFVEADGHQASGKSLLGLLSLGIRYGDTVKIWAEGADAQAALEAIAALFATSGDAAPVPAPGVREPHAAGGTRENAIA